MLIAILNQSTLISNADAVAMTQAIASQVRLDAAPLWDRAPAAVIFYTDPGAVPAPAHGIAIVASGRGTPSRASRRGCSASTPRIRAGSCGAWWRQSRSLTTAGTPPPAT